MKAQRSRWWTALVASLSLALYPVAASGQNHLVTVQQAKSLVFEALMPKEKKVSAGLEARSDERYLYVTVVPSRGQGVLDFAVDRRTADVWTTSACSDRTSPRLRRLQLKLREQLRLSPGAYVAPTLRTGAEARSATASLVSAMGRKRTLGDSSVRSAAAVNVVRERLRYSCDTL